MNKVDPSPHHLRRVGDDLSWIDEVLVKDMASLEGDCVDPLSGKSL
jgi:hypothetical protein